MTLQRQNTSAVHPSNVPSILIFIGVALLGLTIRLAPLLRDGVGKNPDSQRYIELSQGLSHGCGFARWKNGSCGAIEAFRTPGYPLFLANLPSLRFAVAIQGLLGAGASLLVTLFVWHCWGFAAAITTELIVVLDVPSILFGSMILSDLLFQTMVTIGAILGLWAIARRRGDRTAIGLILFAALLFGLAILVRPIGIILLAFAPIPALLLPNINWRRSITVGLLAFMIPALFVYGWSLRNERRFGVRTLSTVGAVNFYFYRAAGVVWYRGNRSFSAVQEDFGQKLGWPMQIFNDAPPSLEGAMISRASRIISGDPVGSTIMTLRCFGWLCVVPERADLNAFLGTNAGATSYLAASGNLTKRIQEMMKSPLLTILVLEQFIVMIFVWIGVARTLTNIRHRSPLERWMILIPLSLTVAFLILSSGAESVARFRLPATPLLAMTAGVGLFGRFRIENQISNNRQSEA